MATKPKSRQSRNGNNATENDWREGEMESETFIKLVFYMFIAPFWLAWKISVLAWNFVFKPLNQSISDKRADTKQKQLDEAAQTAHDARNAARQQQLDALQAAAPKSLPESLRATIQINSVTVADREQRRIPRVFADDSIVYVEGEERTEYAVDMILELPEAQRAIIKQYNLHEYVIEDEPRYSSDQLAQIEQQHDGRAAAFKNPNVAEIFNDQTREIMNMHKAARLQTKLGDYLVSPCTKLFKNRVEANQYAEKLKTKILPQIKTILEANTAGESPQTIQL
jgi:hypothetical protein